MEITAKETEGVLTVKLQGELDHHGATAVRKEIDAIIEGTSPQKVLLALDNVFFCDSSGLGLIMGRYKKSVATGAEFAVLDPSSAVERIMRLAGLTALIKTERSVP